MKRSLVHLPRERAQLLFRIRDVVAEVAGERLALLVLFGSYARGDWKDYEYEEGGSTFLHRSDIDLLLMVAHARDAHGERARVLERQIEQALKRESLQTTKYPTAHIIIHGVKEVNRQLRKGHYFFVDIQNEGVQLARRPGHRLARARLPDPQQRRVMAEAYFEQWVKSAAGFFKYFKVALASETKQDRKMAAFFLHQVTEHLYAAVLLVFTHYKPRTHDLKELGRMAASQHVDFATAFPQTRAQDKRCFELLRAAYVEARYRASYRISKAELDYLAKRVRKLQRLTRTLCQEKINSLGP